MRKTFEIRYPSDHPDKLKRGQKYKPPEGCMVVMNNAGVFFLYNGEPFYPSIKKLSDTLPKYDVTWL
jgi:hypothetical protein